MVDCHLHLLPGVDDGPETLEEAVAMARAAARDGCSALIVTPHQRHTRWLNLDLADLAERLERLRAAVGPTPSLHLGAEVRDGEGLLADVEAGRLLGLAGGRYLLLEVDRRSEIGVLEDLVNELVLLGRIPLLAHIERIPWLARDPDRVAELVALGATTQITTTSMLGGFGRGPEVASWELLAAGLVDVLASDGHGIARRPPGLRVARTRLERSYGVEVGRLLTETNPRSILAGEPLERTFGHAVG